MTTNRGFMWAALEEAEKGRGRVGANPLVGAVLVREGKEISRGAHLRFGGPHAEAEALAGVNAGGATLFVTLEPCAHHGKTPPCATAVAEAGVARVFVGMLDPDPRTDGKGAAALREAGVEVEVGLLGDEVRRQALHHVVGVREGRAAVTLKVAVSLDGRLAAADGSSKWITSEACRRDGRVLRDHHEAIMVGAGTVLADDPTLDRDGQPDLPWTRVVVDRDGRAPAESGVFANEGVLWWGPAGATAPGEAEAIRPEDLFSLLADLRERGMGSILVEGGGLGAALLEAGLVDRLVAYVAPRVIGARGVGFAPEAWESLGDGVTLESPRFTPLAGGFRVAGEVVPCSPG